MWIFGRRSRRSRSTRGAELTRVSVVIPTRGGSERLHRCLDAVTAQSVQAEHVLVILSASGRREDFASRWLNVRMVSYPGPVSFARAANGGIRATDSEWVLLLNDDVVLAPTFIERLLGAPRVEPRVGMLCGKLLSADGERIDSTGQFLSRARTASERGYRQRDVGQFDRPGYVFSVPGAAALYRRRMLDAIRVGEAYFDEAFGSYLEDLELGWRAQRAGWRAYYVPGAVGCHARGATAKQRSPRWAWLRRYYLPWLPADLQARYVLNRYRLIARYDTVGTLLRDSPWILWYELRLWGWLVYGAPRALRVVVGGLADALRGKPSPEVRLAGWE